MRIWTLCLSILVHAVAVILLVAVPLFATGVLPVPRYIPILIDDLSNIPALPPPAKIRRMPPTRPVAPEAAPITAPEAVLPDTFAEPTATLSSNEAPSATSGDPAGIDGGAGEPERSAVAEAKTPPVRPGGLILPPRKIHDVAPTYPAIARASHTEGIVILEALIGEDGVVQEVHVLRSVRLLDAAAIEAVRQWRFTPTLLNGQPVPIVMTVTVSFSLR
jgi:periplasmic protein TonB